MNKPVILLFTEYSCCEQSPFLVGGALPLPVPRRLLRLCTRRSGLDNIFGIVLIKSCYVLAVVLDRSRFQVFRHTRRRRLLKTFRGCSTPSFPSLCFFLCSSLPFSFPSLISNPLPGHGWVRALKFCQWFQVEPGRQMTFGAFFNRKKCFQWEQF